VNVLRSTGPVDKNIQKGHSVPTKQNTTNYAVGGVGYMPHCVFKYMQIGLQLSPTDGLELLQHFVP